MPPKKKKQDESKKTAQKKKNQLLEDKTFGLKNKNKSKKVQQHIQSVTKSVMNSGDRKQRQLEEQRKKAKADAKARKKAAEAEQNALFGEALMAVQKKKSLNAKGGKQEAKGRDAGDEDTKKGTSRAMKMMYQMDAKEMNDRLREDPNYVPTLEDEVEMQRQKKVEQLKQSGKKGTPITPETFAAWQERKRLKRAAEAKKRVEAEMKKKKGGKGLSVLSGRDLYEYKKSLFEGNDDEDENAAIDLTSIEEQQQQEKSQETKPAAAAANGNSHTTEENGNITTATSVEQVAAKVQSDLFLEGDDDDLDDLDDD